MSQAPDIAAGRLPAAAYERNFADLHPPLSPREARVAAERCLFCYDAPCVQACPTGIDIPPFIRQIATGNPLGSAKTILDANIMGGMCARVCPTEMLCEEACVRKTPRASRCGSACCSATRPMRCSRRARQLYRARPATGQEVAVVGAGPAGLSCAHRLAMLGHAVTVFEARDEARRASTNTASRPTRRSTDFAAGARSNGSSASAASRCAPAWRSASDSRWRTCAENYDAVFLGLGLAGVNALGAGRRAASTASTNAVDYIAEPAPGARLGDVAGRPPRRRDRRRHDGDRHRGADASALGAEEVTIVYRRGQEHMGASGYEQEFAQTDGVTIRHWLRPSRLLAERRRGSPASSSNTRRRPRPARRSRSPPTWCSRRSARAFVRRRLDGAAELVELEGGRIEVDDERRTSLAGVWAGGDCVGRRQGSDRVRRRGRQARGAVDRTERSALAGREEQTMADLTHRIPRHQTPNPFWLASAPPTDKAYNVDARLRGRLGRRGLEDARRRSADRQRQRPALRRDPCAGPARCIGFNNIELITDRPLADQPARRSSRSSATGRTARWSSR